MRVLKYVQLGFGVVVAGAALAVSAGTALAASDDAATAAQPVVTAPADASGDQTGGHLTGPAAASAMDTSNASTPGVTGDTGTLGPSGSTNVGSKHAKLNNQTSQTTTPAAGSSSTDSTTGTQPQTVVTGGKSDNTATKGDQPNVSTSTDTAAATPALPKQADQSQPVARTTPVIWFHSTVLPIQPIITSRPAINTDLASSVPSAPEPVNAPVPAKSNGDLGHLSVLMAGVVVPHSVHPSDVVSTRMATPGFLILVLLAASMFVFTYGLWLRRGGFATAARSDTPRATVFTSLFATPLSLGYVWTPPRQDHSPILVPVVYEMLRFNMFPMLTERRIYV